MSKYPVWWDTTITVYNKYTDPQTQLVSWYKTKIDKTFWKYIHDKVTIGDTVLESNKIVCRIRENALYMDKYLWNALSSEDKAKYFTLGQGDILVKGDVSDTIDEYVQGQRSTDLIEKYKELQGCFEVQIVHDNTGKGRGLPHYLAQGV